MLVIEKVSYLPVMTSSWTNNSMEFEVIPNILEVTKLAHVQVALGLIM